jgi:ubiquinone/menaquinone biosynthesis C-methylase UbiE
VLEVGFGGGELIEWLLSASEAEVIGVDRSEAMLMRARRRFRAPLSHGRLQLHAGSVDALPLEGRAVDKACSVNSLYFWPDMPRAIGEFARVLRPGGRLVLCFQTPEAVRAWPGHVHGFRAYGADEIEPLLAAVGFASIRTVSGEAPEVGKFLCMSGELRDGR